MTTNCKSVCEAPEAVTAVVTDKTGRPVYEPAADVIEKTDAIHVLLDLPGVDQKGLDVTVEEHVLRIRGTSGATEPANGAAIYREFETCDYERTFRLTTDIDEVRINAALKNGLLRLVLPKKPQPQPQKISVSTE